MDLSEIYPAGGRPQSLYCENCEASMDMRFSHFSESVSGINISIKGLPTLHCEDCDKEYLPDDSRFAIIYLHEQATKAGSDRVTVVRNKKEVDYKFSNVPFLIDADDYFYLPGLYRKQNVGFLSPLFFNKAVLIKYDNSPDYRVTFASPAYGEIEAATYAIPFGINRFGRIVMWLGDVAKLPEAEQFYLRSENVESDHSLGSDFYDGQIECKFTELTKEKIVLEARSKFIGAFDKKFGVKLAHLDTELIETIAALTPPVIDTEKERRYVFDSLNRIFLETLDNGVLNQVVKSLGATSAGSGSLKRLQALLETFDGSGKVSNMLMPFYVLYDLRIAYSHLTSGSRKSQLITSSASRLGLAADFDLPTAYGVILDLVAQSLSYFSVLIEPPSTDAEKSETDNCPDN
ncbi:hypothetical protein EBB79_17125 [Parasedimentitalea marina]|uniref:YgiT-type zinc finger protein n=1 Tax=Parasedimentitalea marina TaxID=2483033 RepID=A0A3T0N5V4_9RHOB|nr:hypothetical protein [Parasedimentitalea marina]AZV79426.1 hypothetical protein EBB79_17125 [Parasedimentitalea marina]